MKTRIISGIVMGILFAAIIAGGLLWHTSIITLFVAVLAGGAAYELLHNAAGIKSVWLNAVSIGYVFFMVFALDFRRGYFPWFLEKICGWTLSNATAHKLILNLPIVLSIFYFFIAVCAVLKYLKEFGLGQIGFTCGILIPLSFAFHCLNSVIKSKDGLYYLLLMLVFSCVCDMGAYFVGVTCGKHKLCPEISPKKTVEGAIGGIVSAMIFAVILILAFAKYDYLVVTVILTIPFCIIGMLGDLFASAIKRTVGLKDYSNLIPGHGGIMDRFDSMLLIAPFLFLCISVGVI